jgi:hypothetical protein
MPILVFFFEQPAAFLLRRENDPFIKKKLAKNRYKRDTHTHVSSL